MANELQKSEKKSLPKVIGGKQTIHDMMEIMGPQLQHMLPSFIDSRKLLAVLLSACQRQPLLYQCSTRSFIGALLECAMIGLYPDGSLGHAWFIPFKTKGVYHVQLIIGYKGYQTLALNTGQVIRIKAVSVHKGDEFEWREGLHPFVNHKPTAEDRGANTLTHVYAYAKLKADPDDPQFVVLTRAEIDRVMNGSKAGTRGPWGNYYVAMGRKTGINRVCNTLQLSPDLSRAATLDDMAAGGINQRLAASPLLEQIGQDLGLPEPEFDDDDDDDGGADNVPMPKAKARDGKQGGSQGGSAAKSRSEDPKPAQDAPAAQDQELSMGDMRPETEPETPAAEPQDAQDAPEGSEGTSGGDLFPDAPPAQPSTSKKRPWKPSKRLIDMLLQDGMAHGWTLDQMLQYTEDEWDKALSDLTKDQYDLMSAHVIDNQP